MLVFPRLPSPRIIAPPRVLTPESNERATGYAFVCTCIGHALPGLTTSSTRSDAAISCALITTRGDRRRTYPTNTATREGLRRSPRGERLYTCVFRATIGTGVIRSVRMSAASVVDSLNGLRALTAEGEIAHEERCPSADRKTSMGVAMSKHRASMESLRPPSPLPEESDSASASGSVSRRASIDAAVPFPSTVREEVAALLRTAMRRTPN